MGTTGQLIVIADDNSLDRESFTGWLSRADESYQFLECETTAAAIQACQTMSIGCLLLDYSFPDGDGIGILDRITGGTGVAPFPVVMVTGLGDDAVAVQALKRGALDYIVKGAISPEGLRETVREAIARFAARPQLERQRVERERDHRSSGLSSPARERLILIMDDSPEDREWTRRTLARSGPAYRFIEESDPIEGLALCRSAGVDCLLLDFSLTGRNGLEFLDELTGGTGIAPFPVVMMTGRGDHAVAVQSLKRGAVDYLIKGRCSPAMLRDTIESAIERMAVRRIHEDQRILELDRLEAESRLRAEKLAAADRSKDEFLAMLAHELRNPMAPIANALYLVRKSGPFPETVATAVDIAERQLKHLSRLVDDLMEVSRITRGRISYHSERVEIGPIVRQVAEVARPSLESRGHHLALTIPDAPLYLDADPARMEQILANLVNNAVKYTGDGGHIQVDVGRVGPDVTIRVIDDGMGIDATTLPRVFELFAQGDRSLDRSEGGLGIGLTLVRSLAEQQGGTVAARSGGEGLGSEFTVTFPSAPIPTGSAGDLPTTAAAIAPMVILVIDDNVDGARMLSELLRAEGHHADFAHDGPSGLAAILAGHPDAVFLDIGLPEMDGYEVARAVRGTLGNDAPTLVACTGYGTQDDFRRSKEAGFQYHLVKPVDPDAILKMIETISDHRHPI